MSEREVGGLRCSRVLEHLSDYLDGDLPEFVVRQVELHLAGCPNCQRFGSEVAGMLAALGRLHGSDSISPDALRGVRDALDGASNDS